MFSLWNKSSEIGIYQIYATKMYLSTDRELCRMSVSGIMFGGRNSSSATKMSGSDLSPGFTLRQADKICGWISLRIMGIV